MMNSEQLGSGIQETLQLYAPRLTTPSINVGQRDEETAISTPISE
jgi:hypothetical protein